MILFYQEDVFVKRKDAELINAETIIYASIMLVAIRAATFTMRPREIEAFGEKTGFIVESGRFKNFHVFRRDEERDGVRLVFDEAFRLFHDWFQKRDGIPAGADGSVEADADRHGRHALEKSL